MLDKIKSWGAKGPDIIKALEQNVSDAQANLESVHERANYAFYKESTSGTAADKKTADNARDELVTAQRLLDEATGSLLAGRAVAEQEAKEYKFELNATARKDAEKIAKRRMKLAVELEAMVENLHIKTEELYYAGQELVDTAVDHGVRVHRSPLSKTYIEGAFRLALWKAGWKWSAVWSGNPSDIVSISQTVKNGNDAVLNQTPANKDAA
jgi:hypothetical protein